MGFSADLLVPKWFEKDPRKSIQDDVEGLIESARLAARAATSQSYETVFELWWRTYQQRVHGQSVDSPDRLLRGFGVALVERAVMDAVCRLADMSFFDALKADLFQVEPHLVYPELDGWSLAQSLPTAPLEHIALRHTIGLLDPLRDADIEEVDRVDDGLPQSFEDDVRVNGLKWFKLKLSGDSNVDIPRTLAFGEVLSENVGQAARFTVDGNEQFSDASGLLSFFQQLDNEPGGRALLEGLLYIEQPLPRAISLVDEAAPILAALKEIAPVILDEADHGVEALPRALDLGYGGVSVKNCKGVLRAMLHRGLCEQRGAFQSGEDLTNMGVLALQQDLATMSALGLGHVERNGHHYFRGLDHLSKKEAASAAEHHPDLWKGTVDGHFMKIVGGNLDISSLQSKGYGYASKIDWEARTPLERWTFTEH
ncbi:MAG: mandelate racemase [bacterium]|nr:mandelate racemase [Deltaproteobacteria bacterium]MCP4905618.1 mandelate racemase [bacterium]